jgi:hypothetical protein
MTDSFFGFLPNIFLPFEQVGGVASSLRDAQDIGIKTTACSLRSVSHQPRSLKQYYTLVSVWTSGLFEGNVQAETQTR